ncbi:hypothetical protein PR048_012513 [Dryococelus australis]|uniref:Uncharacterized protein n=1 Tax=Dryococelus australis TaxID=614101 RepID=A0ABQ9HPP5_9NEOP|nr:hypothetical protein PR048_012513 [Dryococelus australis]
MEFVKSKNYGNDDMVYRVALNVTVAELIFVQYLDGQRIAYYGKMGDACNKIDLVVPTVLGYVMNGWSQERYEEIKPYLWLREQL